MFKKLFWLRQVTLHCNVENLKYITISENWTWLCVVILLITFSRTPVISWSWGTTVLVSTSRMSELVGCELVRSIDSSWLMTGGWPDVDVVAIPWISSIQAEIWSSNLRPADGVRWTSSLRRSSTVIWNSGKTVILAYFSASRSSTVLAKASWLFYHFGLVLGKGGRSSTSFALVDFSPIVLT